MARFIPGDKALVFPQGTTVAHPGATWTMYINRLLNTTWIGYAVPGGTMVTQLPGVRDRMTTDLSSIDAFVTQRQATACGQCGG